MMMSSPANLIDLPADRSEAKTFSLPEGKFLSSSKAKSSVPTAPVAPRMATLYFLLNEPPKQKHQLGGKTFAEICENDLCVDLSFMSALTVC